ncbi:MAG: glutaminyl-peptide cyclotransferase [Euryarchaeota archaeon]|nr:glutaminyl-peptide cyclotransferase [Euryarchaeota archaeon]MBT4391556.1 glutaminyl-peptide cyclotransferase [Euryarchaeota archaeon]MBT6683429.1 glutaminyl-peptide cyclotransferase [Euryarchaeota archaeon]MBT7412699.1 glutaminyl-peptide cyclotransferase [Euryarchaeota archaeon]
MFLSNNSLEISYADSPSYASNVLKLTEHDENAFTQGLEMYGDRLFESTGLYGSSSLREVNASSGQIIRQISFSDDIFAEGITIINNTIILLTWKENIALIIDIDTFDVIGNYTYSGEGWGLCNDGKSYVMSNGSSEISFRNLENFDIISSIVVIEDGIEIPNLNELECVGNSIYANIWGENRIIEINMSSGQVEKSISIDSLEFNKNSSHSVLNGIAYSPSDNAFWITGKYWSKMYLTEFIDDDLRISEDFVTEEEGFLTKYTNKIISFIIIIIIAIFVMPGSWPFFSLIFYKLFKRQTEHLGASGKGAREDEIT